MLTSGLSEEETTDSSAVVVCTRWSNYTHGGRHYQLAMVSKSRLLQRCSVRRCLSAGLHSDVVIPGLLDTFVGHDCCDS